MSLKNISPVSTAAWQKLKDHYSQIKDTHIISWFEDDTERVTKMTINWNDFLVDFSKNRVNDTTWKLLLELAQELDLKDAIDKYFGGDIINETEGRAVLHTALRAAEDAQVYVDGLDVIPEIQAVKEKINSFSESIINGAHKGFSGKPIDTIVNIGIGGSDLGPAMVVDSLSYYQNHLKTYFVSNVDGDHVSEILKKLNPETTLFVIVSKTFTTQETISNASTIRSWFLKSASKEDVAKHFVAVSTNIAKVKEFGIAEDNIFPMWDWVGGRFSLWSAVGLSISLSVGYENFDQLLEGAREMDEHFKDASFDNNIPVLAALLSVWYNNFFGAESQAVIPYSQYLSQFATYLQQG
ncbi:glucose-6-phosphate isomerase, partial [Aegicerativicinus sediminis]